MCFCVRYLVVLSKTGAVSAVCGVTGLTIWEESAEGLPILNMKLLQEEEDQAQLLFVLQDQDSGGYLLRIVSFPGEL